MYKRTYSSFLHIHDPFLILKRFVGFSIYILGEYAILKGPCGAVNINELITFHLPRHTSHEPKPMIKVQHAHKGPYATFSLPTVMGLDMRFQLQLCVRV